MAVKKAAETSSKSSTPAKKATAARKPAAKKAAAKKATARSTAKKAAPAKKRGTAEKAVVKPVAKKAAAKTKAKAKIKVKAARPAPERVPGRKERRGVVVSDAMEKTIVVRVDAVNTHKRYGKVLRRSTKLHAHDEHNVAGVGDLVRVVETRPLSTTKRWRLLDVLERAK
jgi:small subunit ribosomal protein S17